MKKKSEAINLSTLLTDDEFSYVKLALLPPEFKRFRILLNTVIGKMERGEFDAVDAFADSVSAQFPKVLELTEVLVKRAKQKCRDAEAGYARISMQRDWFWHFALTFSLFFERECVNAVFFY